MSALEQLVRHPFVAQVGSALVHFLWQGVAIALLCGACLYLLRSRSASARYGVACLWLFAMAVCPFITFGWLGYSGSVSPSAPALSVLAPAGSTSAAELAPPTPDLVPAFLAGGDPSPLLGWMVVVWVSGVVLLALQAVAAWAAAQRLGRRATRPVTKTLQQKVAELSRRMGICQAPAARESDAVQVPCVIGWSRCVVLLPAAVVTHMPPLQLEALIAHELAHVRRHDYLVNLFQTAVETLLFYHPAVWWVSARIRTERESCCDDLAVHIVGDRITYARALATLEEMRSPQSALALASNGGNLMFRIRRLTGSPSLGPNRTSGWLAAGILFTALMAVFGVTRLQASPQDTIRQRPMEPARSRSTARIAPSRPARADVVPARPVDLDPDGIIVAEVASARPSSDVAPVAPAVPGRPALAPARGGRRPALRAGRAADVAAADEALAAVQADRAAQQDREALLAERRALEAERDALRAARRGRDSRGRDVLRASGRALEQQERELRTRADVARRLDQRDGDLLKEHQRLAEQERRRADDMLRASRRDPFARRSRGADEAPADVFSRVPGDRDELMAQIADLRRRLEALERENQRLRQDDRRRRPQREEGPLARVEQRLMEQEVLSAHSRLEDNKKELEKEQMEMTALRQKYGESHPVILEKRQRIENQTARVKREQLRLEELRKEKPRLSR
jgi:beta-lactamase regulating signal transducer with metallopeptidase domain